VAKTGEKSGMKRLGLTIALVIAAIVPATAAQTRAKSQPQSREVLYLQCSREMAQKYGQPGAQYGTKPNYRIIPYTHWTVIDQCVANGGRLN
jgi:hypothetical protein